MSYQKTVALPNRRYEIILADPPWGGYTPSGTAKISYPTMSTQELCDFPVGDLMEKRCVLFVWVTSPLLMGQQAQVLQTWVERYGLTYQGMPYIWVKTKKDGTPIGASGPRPRLVKPVTEFVLAYSNVKRGRPFPLLTESQRQLVMSPKARLHSQKPQQVADNIVELLGNRPRIELFARRPNPGWDVWGNEAPT